MVRKTSLRVIFSLYILVLILLSILPLGSPVMHFDNFNFELRLDYIIHCLLYTPWIFLAANSTKMKMISVIIFGVLIGLFTEMIQYFLSYRSFNINDLFANVLGILLGLILLLPRISNNILKMFKSV